MYQSLALVSAQALALLLVYLLLALVLVPMKIAGMVLVHRKVRMMAQLMVGLLAQTLAPVLDLKKLSQFLYFHVK